MPDSTTPSVTALRNIVGGEAVDPVEDRWTETLSPSRRPGEVVQRRLLQTPVPGPRSMELHAARGREVARGFGTTLPVFVERAEGAVIVDVDGNQLIDLARGEGA